MSKLINIFGTGGHSKELVDLIKDTNKHSIFNKYVVDKFIVNSDLKEDRGTNNIIINDIDFRKSLIINKDYFCLLAIGNPKVRKNIVEYYKDYKFNYPCFIHPSVRLNSSIKLGTGVIITKNSSLTTNIKLNSHVQLNTGCIVCHDVEIGEYTIISPGAVICGCVKIGKGCFIGAGATIKDGVNIIDNTTIGAGALVVKDIKESGVYIGVPAIKIGDR